MEKFLDRELSALEFNGRVLAEGKDSSNPLLERLKFAGIVSSNLDEFYMVRIASLEGSKNKLEPVLEKARTLFSAMNTYFLDTLVPELAAAGILRLQPETCTPAQLEYLRAFFAKEVLPVLTPIPSSTER